MRDERRPRTKPGHDSRPVRIFDTTLRDGQQSPGAGLTVAEKVDVARQLVRFNVDVIEAGFSGLVTRRALTSGQKPEKVEKLP